MGIRSSIKSAWKRLWLIFTGSQWSSSKIKTSAATYEQEDTLPAETMLELQGNIEGDIPTTLSCETYEVSVAALIDYVDKSGKFTRREITTEEVYDYEDGVLVIRAFCHRRKDFRTFVSKRIQHWKDADTGELVPISSLSEYLRSRANIDPAQIAKEIYLACFPDLNVAINFLTRFSGNKSTPKDRIEGKKRDAVLEWIWDKQSTHRRIAHLPAQAKEEAYGLLKRMVTESRLSPALKQSSISALRKGSAERKTELIDFISSCLAGFPEHDSAIAVLKEELINLSFTIKSQDLLRTNDLEQSTSKEEFNQSRMDAEPARLKYKKAVDKQSRSIAYRYYERKDPVRIFALKETQRRLGLKLEEGEMVFDREEFELGIRRSLLSMISEEDLEDQGEMFLRRLGSGIGLGYVTFGLKKKNRGWYEGPDGRVIIDLRNISPD